MHASRVTPLPVNHPERALRLFPRTPTVGHCPWPVSHSSQTQGRSDELEESLSLTYCSLIVFLAHFSKQQREPFLAVHTDMEERGLPDLSARACVPEVRSPIRSLWVDYCAMSLFPITDCLRNEDRRCERAYGVLPGLSPPRLRGYLDDSPSTCNFLSSRRPL